MKPGTRNSMRLPRNMNGAPHRSQSHCSRTSDQRNFLASFSIFSSLAFDELAYARASALYFLPIL